MKRPGPETNCLRTTQRCLGNRRRRNRAAHQRDFGVDVLGQGRTATAGTLYRIGQVDPSVLPERVWESRQDHSNPHPAGDPCHGAGAVGSSLPMERFVHETPSASHYHSLEAVRPLPIFRVRHVADEMRDRYDGSRGAVPVGSGSVDERAAVIVRWAPAEQGAGSSVGYPLLTEENGDGDGDSQMLCNGHDGSRDAVPVAFGSVGETAAVIGQWIHPELDAFGDPLFTQRSGDADADADEGDGNIWKH